MHKPIQLASLFPLLLTLTPQSTFAAASPEEVMVVTSKLSGNSTHAESGSGFKTNDIDIGPLGNRSWVETPYSTTTVTKEMIENQQAHSVSE